ncbi:MAG: hypothetical protein WD048_02705 [Chitinophagales bacterium]
MTNSTINIRTATPRDAEQIALVHIDSWRTTYKDIVSNDFLDNLNVQTRSPATNRNGFLVIRHQKNVNFRQLNRFISDYLFDFSQN